MRFRAALFLTSLFMVCFTVAAWSTPNPERLGPADLTEPPDNQSLSGKIASIGDAAFSLAITKEQKKKTVEFLVDEGTKVAGKLRVGSQATVEYCSDSGRNIAVRVVVTPASGVSSY
jgi:hypothetical protein